MHKGKVLVLVATMKGNKDTITEKQLATVYATLSASEAVTGTAPVIERTTYPIVGYIKD
jgi:hypothetical protein